MFILKVNGREIVMMLPLEDDTEIEYVPLCDVPLPGDKPEIGPFLVVDLEVLPEVLRIVRIGMKLADPPLDPEGKAYEALEKWCGRAAEALCGGAICDWCGETIRGDPNGVDWDGTAGIFGAYICDECMALNEAELWRKERELGLSAPDTFLYDDETATR